MGRLGQQWRQNMGDQLPLTGDIGEHLPVSSAPQVQQMLAAAETQGRSRLRLCVDCM